jgi:hypothetical protein
LSLNRRLSALEKLAAYAAIQAPAIDYKALLIAKVAAVAERAGRTNEMQFSSAEEYEQCVRQTTEYLQQHLRRNHDKR